MTGPAPPANADGPAREWVLACVDNSAYAGSVADHAGWFASHPEVGVDVLHAVEPDPAPAAVAAVDGLRVRGLSAASRADSIVERAVFRLREEGVGPIAFAVRTGRLLDIAARHEAGPIVMGKRGAGAGAARRRLGRHAHAMIRGSDRPVCLAPRVFLPIQRALVVLDADLSHRRALEFVVADFRLSALPLNVVVLARPGEDPEPKIAWAADRASSCAAQVLPMAGATVDEAVARAVAARGADLVVLSRDVLASDLEAQMLRIEERGLWAARTAFLIS